MVLFRPGELKTRGADGLVPDSCRRLEISEEPSVPALCSAISLIRASVRHGSKTIVWPEVIFRAVFANGKARAKIL